MYLNIDFRNIYYKPVMVSVCPFAVIAAGLTASTVGVASDVIVTSQLPSHDDVVTPPSAVWVDTVTTVRPGTARVVQTTSVGAVRRKETRLSMTMTQL